MKKLTWIPALALSTFIGCFPAHAFTYYIKPQTGNTLLESCSRLDGNSGESAQNALYCLGYIDGAIERWTLSNPFFSEPQLCYPDGVTIGQRARVVVKYLRNNPKELHCGASSLVIDAMREAFPCPTAR